ncbi:hypothetical protein V5799_032120 [Amblyomma americanum]|uniref:Ran gtpase-activating protein n=1 Tax=Amblyomma americanum TaxID=6943 RepID=A0AAQ4DS44_AMBAM
MSEEDNRDPIPREVDIEKLFNEGLKLDGREVCLYCQADGRVADPICREGVVLEYIKDVSTEEARMLRHICAKAPVKAITISSISLSALRTAFDSAEGWESLEELKILDIDCGGEDFIIDFSGVLQNLRVLHLESETVPCSFAKTIVNYLQENKSLQRLTLRYSCNGDEAAATIAEALAVNDTLKWLTLIPDEEPLTAKTLVAFAKALTINSTLELVDLSQGCTIEEAQVSSLFEQDIYTDVFKRILITWKQEFLPQLTKLVRENRHYPQVSVAVTTSVDKDLLREFLEAVGSSPRLRALHFYDSSGCFDEHADDVIELVKRTTALKEIHILKDPLNCMEEGYGRERELVRMLDALKENRCVTTFIMQASLSKPETAVSLSELLAVNDTLSEVAILDASEIGDMYGIILQGLRQNYTLTRLTLTVNPFEDEQSVAEMRKVVKRNGRLLDQAVKFVTGDCTEPEAADAARKLRDSAGLVEALKVRTGKSTESVLHDIQAALSIG